MGGLSQLGEERQTRGSEGRKGKGSRVGEQDAAC
jgi:hypothetical protein